MPATAVIATHCDGYCGPTSTTMRTARSRSSSGYLLTRPITQILPRSGVSGNAGTGQIAGVAGRWVARWKTRRLWWSRSGVVRDDQHIPDQSDVEDRRRGTADLTFA